MILMPLLVLGFYALQLDCSNISNALTDTRTTDLNITKDAVNLGDQLMMAGIIIAEVSSNVILQKLGAPIWLTGQVLVWGTIALAQAWVTNVHSFFATCFLLGFCEAGFRNYFATATGSLIAAGVLQMGGLAGLAVVGIFTPLVFVVFILLLPRSPIHTKPIHGCFDLFTSCEREIMHDRTYQEDIFKTEAHVKITLRGVVTALTTYRIWIHTILNLVSLASKGGLQLCSPTIIRSLGFSKINSNLLNSVSSFLVVFLSFAMAWASDKTKQRGLWCMAAFLWSITFGGALFGPTDKDKWTKYVLFTLLSSGNALFQGLNDAWLSINARSPETGSIGLAMVVVGSNAVTKPPHNKPTTSPLLFSLFSLTPKATSPVSFLINISSFWVLVMYRMYNRDGTGNNPSRSLRDLLPLSIPKKRKPKMSEKPSRLLSCPIEIQLHVLEFVPREGLVALSCVNKHLASITQPVLHRDVDVNCPRVSFQHHAAPLVLVLRTLLSRPDLAQAVQHLRFDGYDFVERRLNQLPTTPIFHLTDEDKLKAVQFIKALDLYQGLDWAKAFLKGQVDSLVSLMVALTPKVRSIYLGEFFSVEICYLRMLLSPENFGTPGGSNVHKFEHLRHVTVDNPCATYYHTRFYFNDVYQDFFRLLRLESLSISGSYPESSRPFAISTKLEHLRCLNLERISGAELGRILSIAPNLKELKYTYAWYPLTTMDTAHEQILDMKTLCSSLEGHRQKLEKLELLARDDGDVLAEEPDITCWPLILQGSFLKLHDFSNLRTLAAPWIFIAGPSKGEHPSPLRHVIPKSVVQLTLTDDLCLQPYWKWEPEEICEMVTNYWHDLKDTKTALATMFLVGPLFSSLFIEDELHSARQLARSAGVNFWPVELTIDKSDALRAAKERARRYGPP
ncbi:nicotinamide mononucleotide permease [Fusarium pseudocircinatum]|uniref:Nicotinamide mononucleotide permease n=1 Tax=Fusarium pseudocircinatum TaxID=56676 RepID=A0A8H5PJD6_9HYPO|nr:nicotinamide mononucleotide permease [Fusarium pseudocircinatum]